jgi:uncharacterized membrane protein
MRCPACSTENPAGATFCQNCGASLSAAAPPPPPASGYTQVPQAAAGPAPAGYVPAQTGGLSDNAAAAIAYVTIIPAIIFLVLEPYNRKPFVRFHALQCIGLHVAWFLLGIIFGILGAVASMIHLGFFALLLWPILWLGIVVIWIICVINASQGKWFKLPVIGDFALKQSQR